MSREMIESGKHEGCVNIENTRYRYYYRVSSVEVICFVENSRLAWNRFHLSGNSKFLIERVAR